MTVPYYMMGNMMMMMYYMTVITLPFAATFNACTASWQQWLCK